MRVGKLAVTIGSTKKYSQGWGEWSDDREESDLFGVAVDQATMC